MSVISGFIAFKLSFYPEKETLALLNSFPHHNHLESTVWTSAEIGLGHRKLPIAPQSIGEHQPLQIQASPLVITADARIDNRGELLNRLSIACPLSEQENLSDCYLILKSFLKWGEQCTKYLIGDFAFAIWNNSTKELFAARDHLGIRPFYYYKSENFFAFCSELKGFFQLPLVSNDLDDHAIADFLIGNYEELESTIYKNIKRLPPAHSLLVKNHNISIQRYWKLEKQDQLVLKKDKDYAIALQEQIHQAIACRLRTAFPVGAMLSGGLDSSALTAIANHVLHKKNIPFSTYSYVLPNNYSGIETDEKKFIDILLQKTGNVHYNINASGQSPFLNTDNYFNMLNEPLRDPFYFIQESIYEKAKQNNVRVLLTGIGGDMTASFPGTNCFAYLITQFKPKSLLGLLKSHRLRSGKSVAMLIRQQIVARLLPSFVTSAYRFLLNRKTILPKQEYATSTFLGQRFSLQHDLKKLKRINGKQNALDHQLQIRYAVTSGHLSAFMEHRATTAASFGISVVHPYFDLRVVKFCMSIPHEQFVKDGWYRSLFRRAIDDIVPEEIVWRPDKQPFVPDYTRRLLKDKHLIHDLLATENHLITKYLDKNKIINHIDFLCSSSEDINWHPSSISLLGHGVSLAAFFNWLTKTHSNHTS